MQMKGRLLLAISVLLCSAGAAVAGSGGLKPFDYLEMFEDLKISEEVACEGIISFMSEEIAKRDDGDIRNELIIQLSDFDILPDLIRALEKHLSSDNLAALVLHAAESYVGETEVPLDSFLQERQDLHEQLDKAIASIGRDSVAAEDLLLRLCEKGLYRGMDLDKLLSDEVSLLFESGAAGFIFFLDFVMKDERIRQRVLSNKSSRCLSNLDSDEDYDDNGYASGTEIDSRHYDCFSKLMNSYIGMFVSPELRDAVMKKGNILVIENPVPAARGRGFFDRQYRRIRDQLRECFCRF